MSVENTPAFNALKYTTSYGEKCVATKNDGVVTISGNENGVRQMPLNDFMDCFVKDQSKIKMRKSPEKDTVSFSGSNKSDNIGNKGLSKNQKYGLGAAILSALALVTGLLLTRGKGMADVCTDTVHVGKKKVKDVVKETIKSKPDPEDFPTRIAEKNRTLINSDKRGHSKKTKVVEENPIDFPKMPGATENNNPLTNSEVLYLVEDPALDLSKKSAVVEEVSSEASKAATDVEDVVLDVSQKSAVVEEVSSDASKAATDLEDVALDVSKKSTVVEDVSSDLSKAATDVEEKTFEIPRYTSDIEDVSVNVHNNSLDTPGISSVIGDGQLETSGTRISGKSSSSMFSEEPYGDLGSSRMYSEEPYGDLGSSRMYGEDPYGDLGSSRMYGEDSYDDLGSSRFFEDDVDSLSDFADDFDAVDDIV